MSPMGPTSQGSQGTGSPVAGIRETVIDGVRTVFAHRPGPASAGLLFRVGSADETLATRGITHLVEHLALHRHGIDGAGPHHYNGTTDATHTHFHVTGDRSEIVAYLNDVCAALRDLPVERMETEKEILRTEAAGRGTGPHSDLPLWRYGAQGHGLTSYRELGLPRLDASAIRHWAATRFTRENAVLWIACDSPSGDLPEGLDVELDLRLPSGPRHPMPAVTSALPHTPAYFHGDDGVVVLDAVVRRSTAAAVFSDVLGKALFRELRQKGGLSYTADSDYTYRDADFATITALADALPQKQDAVIGGFIDVLAALRAGRVDETDFAAVRAARRKMYEVPDLAAAQLPAYALGLLTGHPLPGDDAYLAELDALTPADLHAVAQEVWANALLKVPGDRGADWAGFHEAPSQSAEVLPGRRHAYRTDSRAALIVGAEGVSLVSPGNRASVRYDQCAAMLVYADGGRSLIGLDGMSVPVEPTLYELTPDALAPIDAAVPQHVVVPMPARSPDRIPQPQPRRPEPAAAGERGSTSKLWLFGVLSVLWGLVTLTGTADEFASSQTADPDWGFLFTLWLIQAAIAVPLAATARRRWQFRRAARSR
ncbi:insulinase family protein [Streptomyces sp. NPDC006307]|uniref:M16 family metallopeptidase n=1 Tax=Streptomyces sp. NPDC006307 TaxID=3156748 RepID=UPI0033A26110